MSLNIKYTLMALKVINVPGKLDRTHVKYE
jgi:hypothetical protein